MRPLHIRLFCALLGAAWAVSTARLFLDRGFVSDLDQNVVAAHMAFDGNRNPYTEIGPEGAALTQQFPYFYPLPAALIFTPVLWLPVEQVRLVWLGVSCFLFLFLASRDGMHRLLIALSAAFYASAKWVQWSPAMGVMLFAPWAGFLIAAKPQLGLAVLAGVKRWRDVKTALIAAAVLMLLSLIVWTWWPLEWLENVRTANHVRPLISYGFGPLLLLAALRWRTWQGRLLLALSVIPQNPGLETAMLVMLMPRGWIGTTVLLIGTWVVLLTVPPVHTFPDYMQFADAVSRAVILFVYLPALVMVLRLPAERQPTIDPTLP